MLPPGDQAPIAPSSSTPPSPDPPVSADPSPPVPALPIAPRGPGRPRGKSKHRRRIAAARRTDQPVLTPRMSFFVADDGTIDFARTTPATVEQLRKAISHPEAQRQLGLVDDAGARTPPRTWTTLTGTLVDSANAIAVQFAVTTWKLTDDQARLLFLQTDPAVYAQTKELSSDLLDKYFPGGFGAYDKEISLLLLLAGFTANAVQKIQAMKVSGPVVAFSRSADQ